jgi:hypothetical protein
LKTDGRCLAVIDFADEADVVTYPTYAWVNDDGYTNEQIALTR